MNCEIVCFEDHQNNVLLAAFINVLNSHDGTGSHFISLQRGSLFHEALISLPIIQHETDIGSMQLSMTDDHVSQHPGLERRKKETPMNVE